MNYCWSFNKKTNPQKIKKSKLFLELKRHEHTYQERERMGKRGRVGERL
jgi:hypothetical protein